MYRFRDRKDPVTERRHEPEQGSLRLVAFFLGAFAIAALVPDVAAAIEPDLLPEFVWWRPAAARGFARDPLAVLDAAPGVGAEAEWAPLYRGRDGARYESARRSLGTVVALGPVRFANQLDQRTLALRGGDGPWRVDAEQPLRVAGTTAFAANVHRLGLAASVGATTRDARSLAFGARADLAPNWRAEARWSRVPDEGTLSARWDDVRVMAPGRWVDRRMDVGLAGTLERVRWSVVESSLERISAAGGSGDRLAPRLAWRSSRVELEAPGLGFRWTARLEHGEGRQGFRIWRGDAPYATVIGPVANTLATFSGGPALGGWSARVWAGSWSGDVNGALALWPFDELALIAGTRRVAESSARLSHSGLALERAPVTRGWDGGVALWRLAPRADFAGWQATAMGLGRDDPSSGEVGIRSAWACGLRMAAAARWGAFSLRLEGVQWIPLHVDRGPGEESTPGDGGGGPDTGGDSGPRRGEWGGTIVRLGLRSNI